ncbi:hypothetical protein E2C01_041070 [Portunus trituberculatus]|uniref:Uncharacterized protein n=1 Tax=Portunus trituberculatus TaxID=210409 RepID=A0A5B7FQW6_PORTR|nr:hypothetical protein [Portunus trituberculatus]
MLLFDICWGELLHPSAMDEHVAVFQGIVGLGRGSVRPIHRSSRRNTIKKRNSSVLAPRSPVAAGGGNFNGAIDTEPPQPATAGSLTHCRSLTPLLLLTGCDDVIESSSIKSVVEVAGGFKVFR